MLFFKQVLDKRGLLLSPMQMATHGGDHLGSVSWSALAQGVGLDVLVEQFIGVKLWAVAGQDDQAQIVSRWQPQSAWQDWSDAPDGRPQSDTVCPRLV